MDVEKLITLIYEKKPLRDMTDKSYHMRDINRKLWQEVAVEMNTTVDGVKNKWRGLRDTFRKEFNKSKKQKCGDGAESVVTSKWPYYKILLFLSKTVERRNLHGNISPQEESNNNSSSESESTLEAADNAYSQSTIQESSQQIVNTDIHQPSTSGNKFTSTFRTPSRTTLQSKKNTKNRLKYAKNSETNSVDDKFLEIERAKLEILSQHKNREDSDSERQFLLSLLPFLKAVPQDRQLLVRSKLQQVFLEEEQLSTRDVAGAAYRSNETITSTPLPSPMSYTDTDSSRASFYCNDLVSTPHHSSSLQNTESFGVSQ
ncbi:uncharacterized protein LOC126890781 [Diabrotica virgifera virgifera]|uniref:Transcription factor Adf-1-like n=1 Tax=Diabrotica virgifera virgifera TaxID=50390 RepID=A0ABM5L0G6_DIAVI|nr:uncharacterized protein LOC126890781 [Diabrotica virgifera virgifera]